MMDTRLRCAVTAGMPARAAEVLQPALREAGYALAGRAADGGAALRMILETQPDLLLADAVMPGMDGPALARRAQALKLDVRPMILLLRIPECRVPDAEGLEAIGAALIDKPPTAQAILSAVARLSEGRHRLPPEKAARLSALLDALGVPRHLGRDCLSAAIGLVWNDRRRLGTLKALYSEAARAVRATPAQAERAMRHVIDIAWRTGEIEQQHRIFGDTIDARRGRPTCGEMIAQLADILRWEGRQ